MAGTTAGTCLPAGVAVPSADDDDERSLDENLRPMDGQIWLQDVDAAPSDAFQTTTVTRLAFHARELATIKQFRRQKLNKIQTECSQTNLFNVHYRDVQGVA